MYSLFTSSSSLYSAPSSFAITTTTTTASLLWNRYNGHSTKLVLWIAVSALMVRFFVRWMIQRHRTVWMRFFPQPPPLMLQKLLWPNSVPSSSDNNNNNNTLLVLPPGDFGCPWFGHNILQGTTREGPELWFYRQSARLGHPALWKAYFMGSPFVCVSGKELVTQVANLQFIKSNSSSSSSSSTSTSTPGPTTTTTSSTTETHKQKKNQTTTESLFGTNNLMSERDGPRHAWLRKLVGSAMTPSAVEAALPTLQAIAKQYVKQHVIQTSSDSYFSRKDDNTTVQNDDNNNNNNNNGVVVVMEDVCSSYTSEIVQRHILGLCQLSFQESRELRRQLSAWLGGLYSWTAPIFGTLHPAYKALRYLKQIIQQQIESFDYVNSNNNSNTTIMPSSSSSTLYQMKMATMIEEEVSTTADDDDDDDDNDKVDTLGTTMRKKTTTAMLTRQLTMEQLVENTLLLIAAGTETSASILTLIMLALALHPQVHDRLSNEILGALTRRQGHENNNSSSNSLSYDELQSLPYLDAVVKEALRIGAIATGFPRTARTTLTINGMQIPQGWPIFTNIRLSHALDPVTLRTDGGGGNNMNIEKGFRPERWLIDDDRPCEFFPFGVGPRYCLGANLALVEIKVFLVELVRNVKSLHLISNNQRGPRIKWKTNSIIPKPLDGAKMRVEPRKC